MLIFWMSHLFLSTERSILIVTNRSTCSDILGSRAWHHSYSCGLDLGIFPGAVPVVTEGTASVSPWKVLLLWPRFAGSPSILLAGGAIRIQPAGCADEMQEALGLLGVQKASAEHPQASPTAQAQAIRCIWDGAELLLETRVADTGNSAFAGASGHCAWVGCHVVL